MKKPIYKIKGRYGKLYFFTAKEFYEKVLEDSKKDYNWFASASEIVRVCEEKSFPYEIGIKIKALVLKCFRNIEIGVNRGDDKYITPKEDEEAVEKCYNSLCDVKDEEIQKIRKDYLTQIIIGISNPHLFDSLYHPGDTFKNMCKKWRTEKIEKYISEKYVNFSVLVCNLSKDFKNMVNEAEKTGAFIEDEKKEKESFKQFVVRLSDI